MVKADAKQDYYADLELGPTADAEEIKKQFRTLAKQYHPDRNPGREVDVLSKFQAVQAAHEILADPQLKAKYDADRAKLNRLKVVSSDDDPYNFRQPSQRPVPTTTKTAYPAPPPPRPNPQRGAFDGSRERPNLATTSAGADKFGAFTRPTAQWDRAKFDEAARADAARGFASMRSAQSTPQPPQQPPRPRAHPTAPKPYSSDMPPPPTGPSPGFPGMSRAASARKPSSFDPTTSGHGVDEPPTPGSAYANYMRGQRPQASQPQMYFPYPGPPISPTMSRSKPVSPLRPVRSSEFDATRLQRTPLGREAPRPHVTAGGEKTNITGQGLDHAASVHNSPTERRWDESHPDGWHRPQSHQRPTPARHHSSSPQLRQSTYNPLSESSSSDESLPTMKHGRPKAVPRKPRPRNQTTGAPPGHLHGSTDGDAFTGQFPSKNYTRLVGEQPSFTPSYLYPPPPEPGSGPTRRPFPNMAPPTNGSQPQVNGSGGGGLRRSDTWTPKYGLPSCPAQNLSAPGKTPVTKKPAGPRSGGLPAWAIPSSVLPHLPPQSGDQGAMIGSAISAHLSHHGSSSLMNSAKASGNDHADMMYHSSSTTAMNKKMDPRNHPNVSQENVNSTFSAADWEGKFSGEAFIRPTESQSRDRKSPIKSNRTRSRSLGKGSSTSQAPEQDTCNTFPAATGTETPASPTAEDAEGSGTPKAAAFQSGKFSADKWAEDLKSQKWEIPNNELNAQRFKTPKRGSKPTAAKRSAPGSHTSDSDTGSGVPIHTVEVEDEPSYFDGYDAMDVDPSPQPTVSIPTSNSTPLAQAQAHAPAEPETPSKPPTADIDLKNLSKAAPFAPSGTGLKDLDDLNTTLPVEARPALTVKLEREAPGNGVSSNIRHLRLPRPPQMVIAPLERGDLTQEEWQVYARKMYDYLQDWDAFNAKMLDHFRARQEQVSMGMSRHWITSIADGPSANDFDRRELLEGAKAGYTTYMDWLDDDDICRSWWDEANERHRQCMEDLGRVREKVKRAAGDGSDGD